MLLNTEDVVRQSGIPLMLGRPDEVWHGAQQSPNLLDFFAGVTARPRHSVKRIQQLARQDVSERVTT